MTITKKELFKEVVAEEGKVLVKEVDGEDYFCKLAFTPLSLSNTEIRKIFREVDENV